MTIEEKIFERKRVITERLPVFGFEKTADGYVYETDFMGGDFHAVLTVSDDGAVWGKVIDTMNDEEYTRLRTDESAGAYVSEVRGEYEKLLGEVAERCFEELYFTSAQANRITEIIFEKYGVRPDFPWDGGKYSGCGTFRHTDSGKWFALIMNIKRDAVLKNGSDETVDAINLKINPRESEWLTSLDGIYPAYHMNHKNWITVTLDDTRSDEDVLGFVEDSYLLTKR